MAERGPADAGPAPGSEDEAPPEAGRGEDASGVPPGAAATPPPDTELLDRLSAERSRGDKLEAALADVQAKLKDVTEWADFINKERNALIEASKAGQAPPGSQALATGAPVPAGMTATPGAPYDPRTGGPVAGAGVPQGAAGGYADPQAAKAADGMRLMTQAMQAFREFEGGGASAAGGVPTDLNAMLLRAAIENFVSGAQVNQAVAKAIAKRIEGAAGEVVSSTLPTMLR